MTPIAAYYLFTAVENERAAAAAHGIDTRAGRPTLLERIRTLLIALRQRPSLARPA